MPARRARKIAVRACAAAALALSSAGCQLLMDDLRGPLDEDGGNGMDAGKVDANTGDPPDALELDARDDRDTATIDAGADAEPDATENDTGTLPADAGGDADAGAPDPTACDGAGEKTFYRDSDRDGYGDPTDQWFGCEAQADYVDRAGDCHDGNGDVHEGQTDFFGVGYARPDLALPSFDYDCDGDESFGPEQRLQPCSQGLLACSGGGYGVNNQRTNFPGLNPYCGSRDFLICEGLPLLSGCVGNPSTATTPFTCK